MKWLLDNNLAPRLCELLADVFDTEHVRRVGLAAAPDDHVWAYTRSHGFSIVTKDADFEELAVLRGSPPKVVWSRLGNCTTSEVAATLRLHRDAILSLASDPEASILVIRP